ncbi:MAG: hypothetical protein M3Z29_10610 [Pseudomonadota bacterium]|nr:hypothetical protein [Pseudomonadota bacterium]
MTSARYFGAVCALAMALHCQLAAAAPGDVYVAAHRTRDGSLVPANVPPSSGGTHASRHPRHGRFATSRSTRGAFLPPILAGARPIRR